MRGGLGGDEVVRISVELVVGVQHRAAEHPARDIGQSAQVRMVSQDRLQQVLQDLHLSASSQVDVPTLRRVGEFTSAQTAIFGQYVKIGSQIRINTTILDLAHDTRSVVTTDVPDEKDLLSSVDKLATELRGKISADPKILQDLKAHAERPSTTSVEALHDYEDGVRLERAGDNIKAQQQFMAATVADNDFALAFSALAETYKNLGHDDLAQTASRRAVELSDTLPAQERYLIEANNARVLRELAGLPPEKRTARFVCVLAAARDGQTLATFRGTAEGIILEQRRGQNGFGYDPLFYFQQIDKTFAELSAEEKAKYSHRGAAFRSFLEWQRNRERG